LQLEFAAVMKETEVTCWPQWDEHRGAVVTVINLIHILFVVIVKLHGDRVSMQDHVGVKRRGTDARRTTTTIMMLEAA